MKISKQIKICRKVIKATRMYKKIRKLGYVDKETLKKLRDERDVELKEIMGDDFEITGTTVLNSKLVDSYLITNNPKNIFLVVPMVKTDSPRYFKYIQTMLAYLNFLDAVGVAEPFMLECCQLALTLTQRYLLMFEFIMGLSFVFTNIIVTNFIFNPLSTILLILMILGFLVIADIVNIIEYIDKQLVDINEYKNMISRTNIYNPMDISEENNLVAKKVFTYSDVLEVCGEHKFITFDDIYDYFINS